MAQDAGTRAVGIGAILAFVVGVTLLATPTIDDIGAGLCLTLAVFLGVCWLVLVAIKMLTRKPGA